MTNIPLHSTACRVGRVCHSCSSSSSCSSSCCCRCSCCCCCCCCPLEVEITQSVCWFFGHVARAPVNLESAVDQSSATALATNRHMQDFFSASKAPSPSADGCMSMQEVIKSVEPRYESLSRDHLRSSQSASLALDLNGQCAVTRRYAHMRRSRKRRTARPELRFCRETKA
jgi:hypothetical protein